MKQGHTQGISPKAVLAVAFPMVALLVALALTLVGGLDFATAAAAVAAAAPALAGLGAYMGPPGNVPASVVVASDDVLMSDHATRARIMGDPNGTP